MRCELDRPNLMAKAIMCHYLPSGYHYCLWDIVGKNKKAKPTIEELREHDLRRLEQWNIYECADKDSRALRKLEGKANLKYLRWDQFWIVLFTEGEHEVWDQPRILNIRLNDPQAVERDNVIEKPLTFHGYSLFQEMGNDQKWHCVALIQYSKWRKLRAWFLDRALHRNREHLETLLRNISIKERVERYDEEEWYRYRFDHYRGVKNQILHLVALINEKRDRRGYKRVRVTRCLRSLDYRETLFDSEIVTPLAPTEPGEDFERQVMLEHRRKRAA